LRVFGVARCGATAGGPVRGIKGRPAIQAERPLFLDEATFADAWGSDGLEAVTAIGEECPGEDRGPPLAGQQPPVLSSQLDPLRNAEGVNPNPRGRLEVHQRAHRADHTFAPISHSPTLNFKPGGLNLSQSLALVAVRR
jgi:hypothetical protein